MIEKPKTLYHHTSLAGLAGILRSRRLWATDISYLNDAAEFRHAVDSISSGLGAAIEQGSLDPYLATALKVWLEIATEGLGTPSLYVACFSENDDQLSQWRAYAQGGVAIGFDTARLEERAFAHHKAGNIGRRHALFTLGRCEYSKHQAQEPVAAFIADSGRTFEAVRGDAKGDPAELTRLAAKSVWKAFNRVAPLAKHYGFREEAEWRLVSEHTPGIMQWAEVKVRPSGSMVIPYYDLEIGSKAPGYEFRREGFAMPISELVIGPTKDKT